MFPARYFAPRYFAPRYFPKVGAGVTPPAPPVQQESGGGVSFDGTLAWKIQLERLRRIREDEEIAIIL